jgi:hypothetical protein
MFALGIIGFLAGIAVRRSTIKKNKIVICIFGFLMALVVYGGIMNPASIIMWQNNINWDMISSSLNQNKSIDILGDTLREMKYSSNYIPLANGLRLYVSSTEPVAAAGDTIPEGSVGLGWSGVKVYTSGAWV